MGILDHPNPLNDEQFADTKWAAWLSRTGIERPLHDEQGRWPTVAELRQVLDRIEGYDARYNIVEDARGDKHFSVEVRRLINGQPQVGNIAHGPRSPLVVHSFDGDEAKVARFYFEKGWPELHILILKHLARLCGPYTLYGDDAAAPVMINANTDLDAVIAWWGSERGQLFDERVRAETDERSGTQ